MKNTYEPQQIYDVFDRYGFKVLRIDQFDSGSYAKIRAELDYEQLYVNQLLEVTTRLISLERNEEVELQLLYIDMRHRTMTLLLQLRDLEATISG